MKFIKKIAFLAFFAYILPTSSANGQSSQEIKEATKQLMEMQQKMMESLQKGGLSGTEFDFLGDTSFFFKFDTSFFGNGLDLFKDMPFGSGTDKNMDDLGGFFDGFMDLIQGIEGLNEQGQMPEGSEYLDDKGEDDLLPEERLRLQEENGNKTPKDKKSGTEQKAKKRKTTRV